MGQIRLIACEAGELSIVLIFLKSYKTYYKKEEYVIETICEPQNLYLLSRPLQRKFATTVL